MPPPPPPPEEPKPMTELEELLFKQDKVTDEVKIHCSFKTKMKNCEKTEQTKIYLTMENEPCFTVTGEHAADDANV